MINRSWALPCAVARSRHLPSGGGRERALAAYLRALVR
jgi:hypothetical protein